MLKLRERVIKFTESKKEVPILSAVSAGTYPLLYYYNKNFTLLNSWNQFFFFVAVYILIPIVVFFLFNKFFLKVNYLRKYKSFLLPALNLCLFVSLMVVSTYGLKYKISLLFVFFAFIISILIRKHLKKVIILQLILASVVLLKLVPDIYRHVTYSEKWIEQKDNIESIVFEKRPNIYVIQPDGYANFSELKGDNYDFDNQNFESFLKQKKFKLYNDFRSNYNSTLSSNSSMFAMKHHYFNSPKPGMNELYNSRNIIVGDNPVISILKQNNYKTHLLLEKSYLLLNRPKIKYDYCNLNYSEISYFSRGYKDLRTIEDDLELVMSRNKKNGNFYFIEKLKPGHISVYKNKSKGAKAERLKYIEELKKSNLWLQKVINLIVEKDSNSLIVVVADHGGFVGMDYTLQCKNKQSNGELIRTIFTTALAVKWPDPVHNFDADLKTNVNLFRVLFSYLAQDSSYLDNLEEDKSYTIIENGAPFGVYESINENNDIVFKNRSIPQIQD